MQSFLMNSHEVFIHIHQGCFAGTGAIVRLPQCQWSKPDGYGKISQCITTTKHSKAKNVCIFLGIYCRWWSVSSYFMSRCACTLCIYSSKTNLLSPSCHYWQGSECIKKLSNLCSLLSICINNQHCTNLSWPFVISLSDSRSCHLVSQLNHLLI